MSSWFEQIWVKSCKESSMRFVRESSSRYYIQMHEFKLDMRSVSVTHLIKSTNWANKNDGICVIEIRYPRMPLSSGTTDVKEVP